MDPVRRLRWAVVGLGAVLVASTAGYVALGFGLLDAVYQTVMTVTTVGFREVEPLSDGGKVFTIGVILVGVGVALYTFGVLVEVLVEGQLTQAGRRRRMDRTIAHLSGHVIVCGWGRVGRSIARYVAGAGAEVVVIDVSADRLAGLPHAYLVGDATDDAVLRAAGVDRAQALIAAINTDAENLYVTLSGRALNPKLFIVARAREEASEEKLRRAGADRVVNPQAIGGARMAAFVLQPHVAEFLDVVMHDGSLEFRLGEVTVPPGSPLVGTTLAGADIRTRTGALVLALRSADGRFEPNPAPDAVLHAGDVLIAVGTQAQVESLTAAAQNRS